MASKVFSFWRCGVRSRGGTVSGSGRDRNAVQSESVSGRARPYRARPAASFAKRWAGASSRSNWSARSKRSMTG